MQDQEAMQAHRGFKVFRGFVVILVQRVIRAVKVQKVISGHRDRQEILDLPVRQVHRVISVRQVQEVFRGLPVQPGQPVQWVHKV